MSEQTIERPGTGQDRPSSDVRGQLAAYLAGQPNSIKVVDRRMKIAEAIGFVVLITAFAGALYVSFNWQSVEPATVAGAWFIFVAVTSLAFSLLGFHAALIKAFPALYLPGNRSRFVTGKPAVNRGLGSALVAVLWAAIWGAVGYSAITRRADFLLGIIPNLGAVIGLGIGVAILVAIYRAVTR